MASTDRSHDQVLGGSKALPITDRLARLPWWLLITALLGILILWAVTTNETYQVIYERVREGLGITVYVTIIAYALALILGLIVGLARVSRNRVVYHLATFYVEIVRGVPMLVLLYYIAFVVGPWLVEAINALGNLLLEANILPPIASTMADMAVRDLDFTARAVMALTIGYAAFLSEVFRAGIESIERGQMEAARSLGMTYWQAMRYVILPQAIRRVLPPLGNDFVAMLKDSSLVSVLGVRDITMLGKVYSTSTFRFFETYNVVAFLYLTMTILLSLGVRYIERRMSTDNQ
ncbi:MAG: amino acid ABC transporter permease [Anaerolineae bacterium]